MSGPELAIVIPAFNEAKTIADVVGSVCQKAHVIVVNDASQDDTETRAKEAGAEVLTNAHNKGYDATLSIGVAHAHAIGAQYVITMDADGQHDPSLVDVYLQKFKDGYDMVLGIRHRKQRLGEKIFGAVSSLWDGVKDPLCGFKGFNMSLFSALGHYDSYNSINTELMMYALSQKTKFCQIGIETREREDAPRFGSGLKANLKILKSMCIGMFKYRMF